MLGGSVSSPAWPLQGRVCRPTCALRLNACRPAAVAAVLRRQWRRRSSPLAYRRRRCSFAHMWRPGWTSPAFRPSTRRSSPTATSWPRSTSTSCLSTRGSATSALRFEPGTSSSSGMGAPRCLTRRRASERRASASPASASMVKSALSLCPPPATTHPMSHRERPDLCCTCSVWAISTVRRTTSCEPGTDSVRSSLAQRARRT
mmetsp:Transcript_13848/g.30872  ORF Transcript_13848/g.30872 Transcript_13848/m.30872 type:complete len:203 (+) Transcript_13848:297-905(+)